MDIGVCRRAHTSLLLLGFTACLFWINTLKPHLSCFEATCRQTASWRSEEPRSSTYKPQTSRDTWAAGTLTIRWSKSRQSASRGWEAVLKHRLKREFVCSYASHSSLCLKFCVHLCRFVVTRYQQPQSSIMLDSRGRRRGFIVKQLHSPTQSSSFRCVSVASLEPSWPIRRENKMKRNKKAAAPIKNRIKWKTPLSGPQLRARKVMDQMFPADSCLKWVVSGC